MDGIVVVAVIYGAQKRSCSTRIFRFCGRYVRKNMASNRQLVSDFSAGRLSVEAHIRERLQRIAKHNSKINAVVTNNPQAIAQAQAADHLRESGATLPPLFGLPLTIKDLYATAGLRTTAGFKPLAGYVPQEDAVLVARAQTAGAVLLGKTNTAELGSDIQCKNAVFGTTVNPWNSGYTSGGSSGGSAAAIAAGFSALDIGSDLAGSIRLPAAFCGVAGLKVTENRLPRTGHVPQLPQAERSVWHLLSPGLLARQVDDLRLGLQALLTARPNEMPTDSTVAPVSWQAAKHKGFLKIAYWDDFNGLPLCPRTQAALRQSIEKLESAGITVQRIRPEDFDFSDAWAAYGEIMGAEVGLGLPAWQRMAFAASAHLLPPSRFMMKSVGRGMRLNFKRYNHALNVRERLIAVLEQFLQQWDAWLCPVAPTTAFPHCKPQTRIAIGAASLPYLEATTSLVTPFSLTGSPVVSLPAGIFDGLPVGLQLVGRRWQDEALLDCAEAVECIVQGFQAPELPK
ncbi:amidase [Lysobacteraceae bacterium NML120232]|nr:amidase [Xanthomonadaceae bacterium NML08-0793]PJK13383.1 amidase [Xanthomonadaceae bacterium NML120232]